ncbi:MAG: Hpt domain-containing protein [Eubacterium sp.]|nr:Hpt domain-containing protein [Eubacterium sp.]
MNLDDLREYGADVDTGVKRCANKETLYLKLVNKAAQSEEMDALENSIASGDIEAAFGYAHGLKGVATNLSLTPLSDPICELTELLRAKAGGYDSSMAEAKAAFENLKKICD